MKETKNLLLVDDTELERELTRSLVAAQHKKDMRKIKGMEED